MNRSRREPAQRTLALVCSRFYPEYGGPGIAFLRLAPRLEEHGFRFIVLAMKPPGAPAREKMSCLDIFRCGGAESRLSKMRWIASVLWWLMVLRHRYQHVHVYFSGWVTFLVPLASKLLGKKASFTMTLLDSDDPENIGKTTMAAWKLRLFRMYDRVIYINPEQADRYERTYGTRDPLIPGSMGIDLEAFQPCSPDEKLAARRELGIGEDALVAAFTGSVIHRKGIDVAVEIWLRVVEREPRALFVVLGASQSSSPPDGGFFGELERRITSSGKRDHFKFLWSPPSVSAVLRLLRAADIFLFPSRNEGTPSAVMEAMACGVVPVITPLTGFANVVVRDQVEGLVLQPEAGPGAAAQRVIGLLDDIDRRRHMAKMARERVHATHSQDLAVAALRRAWESPALDDLCGTGRP